MCVSEDALDAWEYLVDRISTTGADCEIIERLDVIAYPDLAVGARGDVAPQAVETARRLMAEHFAPELLVAFDALHVGGAFPDGNRAIHRAFPRRVHRVVYWTCTVAALRAVSPDELW